MKNEDVSKIEIKYFKNKSHDIKLPEFTICLQNPFLDNRFNEIHSNLSTEGYLNYLTGQIPDNGFYRDLDFDNITIDLSEYIENITFEFRPGLN